ncbi:neutral/alkaline non-lysosomal ceramidase N-terminal domain-containing protein [Jatrophihabitans endophyticus]|uniref:neutral/alkaline non-lysosomal ceramidase N-terminal domain-containing protein n=1 Tax=Jatrophihabitans endophyticus TaxID=1206085 RepID=UPI0019EAC089|nr:neutral/alkaline non-lysosomal ceramidase N-terminal domain-containing protein [Jatrophihabitans endophyticus]MBE7188216.1 neutral/alkaline ceramidase [Jatrophihabitans endophyticus]
MFRVGRGVADSTGEVAECGLLGYGKAEQQAAGLHTRLRSRAFVIEDADGSCVLLVVSELPLPMDSVTAAVLERLAARFGTRYRADNTMLTVTHTHCAPGGYSHQLIYNSNTGGFRPTTFAAIVDGIVEAVERAHADLAPSDLVLTRGELHDASVNRSPTSFERNPAADRAAFPAGIDPLTTMLRIERAGRFVGGINWFATHGTSMTNTNTLVSADNKGYAAYHWERLVAGVDYLAEQRPSVVTAFAQTNAGDMSPNLGRAPGTGPTDDEVENTRLIGLRQYEAAARLAADPGERLEGPVDSRLTYVDLGDVEVQPEFTGDGRVHRTGRAAAAAAQFAGTDEGPGFTGFRQGPNPVWDAVSRRVIYPLAPRLRAAHAPKAIVIPPWLVSCVSGASPMVAERVPVQLLRLGRLYLLGVPGEVTIVAGLRLRRTVAGLVGADLDDVLVAGYANAYIHYVTTPEEYDGQRYEAGSTMFGRWELAALQQVAAGLARAMADGRPAPAGAVPPDLTGRRRSWRRKPGVDDPGFGAFGRVVIEPRPLYHPGDTMVAAFVSAHLAHDPRRGGTFLEIQRDDDDRSGGWVTVADDGDWETVLRWLRVGRRGSRVTVSWHVPADVRPGWYRAVHHAAFREPDGRLTPFTGVSRSFEVR